MLKKLIEEKMNPFILIHSFKLEKSVLCLAICEENNCIECNRRTNKFLFSYLNL